MSTGVRISCAAHGLCVRSCERDGNEELAVACMTTALFDIRLKGILKLEVLPSPLSSGPRAPFCAFDHRNLLRSLHVNVGIEAWREMQDVIMDDMSKGMK